MHMVIHIYITYVAVDNLFITKSALFEAINHTIAYCIYIHTLTVNRCIKVHILFVMYSYSFYIWFNTCVLLHCNYVHMCMYHSITNYAQIIMKIQYYINGSQFNNSFALSFSMAKHSVYIALQSILTKCVLYEFDIQHMCSSYIAMMCVSTLLYIWVAPAWYTQFSSTVYIHMCYVHICSILL